MSIPQLVKIADRCDHLRWKGLFVDTEGGLEETHHPPDRIFWCLKTQQCVGPGRQHRGRARVLGIARLLQAVLNFALFTLLNATRRCGHVREMHFLPGL